MTDTNLPKNRHRVLVAEFLKLAYLNYTNNFPGKMVRYCQGLVFIHIRVKIVHRPKSWFAIFAEAQQWP